MQVIYQWLIRLMRYLSIGSALDKLLLMRAPFIWRSRITHVVWFALLIGLVGVGFSYWSFAPSPPLNVPTLLEINASIQVMVFAVVAVFIIWGISLVRIKLRDATAARLIVTFGLYFLGAYVLLSAAGGFVHATATRIASVVSDEAAFQDRYTKLEGFNFGMCHNPADYPGDKFREELFRVDLLPSEFNNILVRPDCREQLKCPRNQPQCLELLHADLEILSDDGKITVDLVDIDTISMSFVKARYESIRTAVNYQAGMRTSYDFWVKPLDVTRLVLALILAAFLFAISTVSAQPRAASAKFGRPSLDWFDFVTWSPAWLRRFDRRMLRTRPNSWAMRSHMLVLSSFAVTGIVGMGIFAQALLTENNLFSDDANLPFVVGAFVFLGAFLVVLCVLYRLKFPVFLSDQPGVRRYILSYYKPFLPILLTLTFFVTVAIATRELTQIDYIAGLSASDIHSASAAIFIFIIGFAAGQSFAITVFIALKYFPNIGVVWKILGTLFIPLAGVGLALLFVGLVDEIAVGWAFFLILVVFGGLHVVARRRKSEMAAFLVWVLVFPICCLTALAIFFTLNNLYGVDLASELSGVLVVLGILVIVVLGPVMVLRYFTGPLHDRILATSAAPREV